MVWNILKTFLAKFGNQVATNEPAPTRHNN